MLNILCFMSTNMWKKLKFCQIGLVPFVQYFPLSYENCKKSEMNNFLTIFWFKSYHRKRFTERKNLKHFKMGMEIPISSSVLSNKMKTSLQLESGNILPFTNSQIVKGSFHKFSIIFSDAYMLYADVFEIGAFLIQSWSGFSFINDL